MCNASQAALNVLLLGINAACHLLHKYFAVADRKWHLWDYHENEFHHPLKWCTGKHSIHSKSMSFGSFSALVDGSINTATISQTICWEVRTAEKCYRPVIKGIVAWRESTRIKVISELSSYRSACVQQLGCIGRAVLLEKPCLVQTQGNAAPGSVIYKCWTQDQQVFEIKRRAMSAKAINHIYVWLCGVQTLEKRSPCKLLTVLLRLQAGAVAQ